MVSINSTSYKRSDTLSDPANIAKLKFPLIPLPIKEAICYITSDFLVNPPPLRFPLIPLPIKEAITMASMPEVLGLSQRFH